MGTRFPSSRQAPVVTDFVLGFDAISHQVQNHITLVSLRTEDEIPAQAKMLGNLRFGERRLRVQVADTDWWSAVPSLFRLGAAHIAEGTDHLLFLLTLLLPAPLLALQGRWGEYGGRRHMVVRLLWVVTAFTFGHSLTLTAAAVGWATLPPQPVEVVIALSILVSAFHAWRPVFPNREYLIAAVFGLVHGFAFATALQELDLAGARLAVGILAFNLGIESVQLALVTLVAPMLAWLAPTRYYPHLRKVLALTAGAMALFWMAQRITAS